VLEQQHAASGAFGLRIGGLETEAASAGTYVVSSPASGAYVATVADAGGQDVERAVATAADAFNRGEWRRRTAAERSTVLVRIAELLLERQDELALQESLCSGKAIRDCRAEVAAAARYFRFYAGIAAMATGQTIPSTPAGWTSRCESRSASAR